MLTIIAAVAHVGCSEPEQIRSYSVPKEAPPVVAAPPAANPGEATDRMLAAIIPADGQAWFFKLVGPIPKIGTLEKPFEEFVTAVRIEDGKPKWQLPADWKEGTGGPMRYATILLPNEPKPLELTVNTLPWAGTPEAMVENVNRWRGQLQLPKAQPSQIPSFTREVKAGERTATIVDLRGRSGGGGMMPPFAGGAGPFAGGAAPFAGGAQPPSTNLPPGHPPLDPNTAPPAAEKNSPPANMPPADNTPKFDAPAAWKQIPATGMRKAAFTIGEGENGAEVTITPFSLNAPSIADPLANTNMWRGAVGLPPIQQEDLGKYTEAIEIGGKPATYVRLIPDEAESAQSQNKKAALAAMVPSGDQIWFVKLLGDRSAVVGQEEAFKTFLKSLKFGEGGTTDGHK